MITYYNDKTFDLYGLSSDEKPILEKESNGSIFTEIDTGKKYVYDAESKEWLLMK